MSLSFHNVSFFSPCRTSYPRMVPIPQWYKPSNELNLEPAHHQTINQPIPRFQVTYTAMLNLRVTGRWETRGRFFSPTCVGPTRPFYSASPSPFHFTVFTFSSPSASGSSAFMALLPSPFPLLHAALAPDAGTSRAGMARTVFFFFFFYAIFFYKLFLPISFRM